MAVFSCSDLPEQINGDRRQMSESPHFPGWTVMVDRLSIVHRMWLGYQKHMSKMKFWTLCYNEANAVELISKYEY